MTVAGSRVGTDLFAAHGLKHLFQLDSKLLDVVEDDAGLKEENSYDAVSTSICYVHQCPLKLGGKRKF